MDCLTLPPSMPEYRGGRNHEDFLTRLKDHLPERGALASAVPEAATAPSRALRVGGGKQSGRGRPMRLAAPRRHEDRAYCGWSR